VFPSQNQECLLIGMRRIFEYIGGVPVVCHAKRKKLTSKIQKNPPEKKLPGGFKTYLNGFIMPF
jgi:hypothetical protein